LRYHLGPSSDIDRLGDVSGLDDQEFAGRNASDVNARFDSAMAATCWNSRFGDLHGLSFGLLGKRAVFFLRGGTMIHTRICDLLGIVHPIVLGGMGTATTGLMDDAGC